MIRNNKVKVIITSVIILLPMLFGIIMWKQLPDILTTHFGSSGEANGFSGKGFVVFGMPIIFLALHFITLLFISLDRGQLQQTAKALNIVFWMMPAISIFANTVIYSAALDKSFNLPMLIPMLLGVSFILMGNYMPKIKQNSTLGIKVTWALRNEENWNKTHRLGGKVMVIGGFIMMLSAFLPIEATVGVLIAVISIFAIFPIIYSYLIYRRDIKEGIEYPEQIKSKGEKTLSVIAVIVIPVILIGVVIIMFTGDINVECKDSSLKINASYHADVEVDYSEFDGIEYRKDFNVGVRTSGFGSPRLSMGIFQNDELGSYTIYAYTAAKEYILLSSGDKTLVIGMKSAEQTQAIYNILSEKIGKK